MENYDTTDILDGQPGAQNLELMYDAEDNEYLVEIDGLYDEKSVDTVLDERGYTGEHSVAPSKLILRVDHPDEDFTMVEELEAVRSLSAVALEAAGYDTPELNEYAAEFTEYFGDEPVEEPEHDVLDTDHHSYDSLMDTRL